MRLVPFALAVLMSGAVVLAVAPVQAQDSPTRLTLRKPAPKSYLDPGTVVKPGTGRYLNYVDVVQSRYPQYGDNSTITGTRYPLPDQYYLPKY
ncbi:hypothetical protein [Ancylobacter sp. G4_0304]|uniref:hypothetical protein n=1 Tax=Ancylobacter sp. G4_0304 TaxID=3114289 RepID=UPI0039C6ED7D